MLYCLLKKIKPVVVFFLIFSELFIVAGPVYAIAPIALLPLAIGAVKSVAGGATTLAQMALDALDVVDQLIGKVLYSLILLLVSSTAFLFMGAGLLDWIRSYPIHIYNNPMIDAGWHFTLGLTNLLLILIFLIIAFCWILKIESVEMKKALPRLLIVALLVNFSLLFIGMLVDVSWFLQNTFVKTFGESLVKQSIEPLRVSAISFGNVFADIILRGIAKAKIPFANIAYLVFIIKFLLGEIFYGMYLKTILVIIFNFLVGGVYLLFFILFMARISIIWILAILAPLAFLSFILPATKKFWDEWLSTLIEWVFAGIVALFFLDMGTMFFTIVIKGKPIDLGHTSTPGFFANYLFLIIYLLAVLYFVKRTTPKAAEAVVKGAIKYGSMAAAGIGAAGVKALGVPKAAEKVGRWAAERPGFREIVARPLLGYAKRQAGKEEKELKGLPLTTRAALMEKDVGEIVKEMTPKEFLKEGPDELKKPEVFMAATSDQIDLIEKSGNVAQRHALYDLGTTRIRELTAKTQELRREYFRLHHAGDPKAGSVRIQLRNIARNIGKIRTSARFRV